MAVSVYLDVVPPTETDVMTLHVEEAPAKVGVFVQIQTFPAGAYPEYITRVTVTTANSLTDWFRIRWENTSGAFSPYSMPVQGGTSSVVAQVVDRMMLRDPTLNENIAVQEAEAVISFYFNVLDPYTVDPATVTPSQLSGLTMLALARCYVVNMLTVGQTQSYTAGLIQQNTGSVTKQQGNIDGLITMANRLLGISTSFVALIEEIAVAGGDYKKLVAVDLSRTIIEVQ
jgi:hypothetical protein